MPTPAEAATAYSRRRLEFAAGLYSDPSVYRFIYATLKTRSGFTKFGAATQEKAFGFGAPGSHFGAAASTPFGGFPPSQDEPQNDQYVIFRTSTGFDFVECHATPKEYQKVVTKEPKLSVNIYYGKIQDQEHVVFVPQSLKGPSWGVAQSSKEMLKLLRYLPEAESFMRETESQEKNSVLYRLHLILTGFENHLKYNVIPREGQVQTTVPVELAFMDEFGFSPDYPCSILFRIYHTTMTKDQVAYVHRAIKQLQKAGLDSPCFKEILRVLTFWQPALTSEN